MSENTLDHDDLTETQEYFIAGIVILLFGLLYWFLNHGWNSGSNLDMTSSHLPNPNISSIGNGVSDNLKTGHAELTAGALGATALAGSSAVIPETKPTKSPEASNVEGDTDIPAESENTNDANTTDEDIAPLSLSPIEVKKLKAAEKALKNSKEVTDQADKEAKGQAAAINELEAVNPVVKASSQPKPADADNVAGSKAKPAGKPPVETASQPADAKKGNTKSANAEPETTAKNKDKADTYTLPDGTPVKISSNGFEGKFRDAIEGHKLYQPIVFDSIYFESGSTKLNKKSKHQLRATAALLNKYPDTHILLRGHTDSTGGVSRNVQLSLYRANATALALGKLGIDTNRIRIIGVGAAEPVASNKTKEGRKKNRRIEVLITK